MPKLLEKYSEDAYAAMRVLTAFVFAGHGAQKYFGVLGEPSRFTRRRVDRWHN